LQSDILPETSIQSYDGTPYFKQTLAHLGSSVQSEEHPLLSVFKKKPELQIVQKLLLSH